MELYLDRLRYVMLANVNADAGKVSEIKDKIKQHFDKSDLIIHTS